MVKARPALYVRKRAAHGWKLYSRDSWEVPIDADILRIPVGPGSMHVERYGRGGGAVLLVHGFATSSFLWREVAPIMAVANKTAYAVDLFGYGESDRPFDADFGLAAQAEYLDRALTALRLRSASVVGCDLGGAVAVRLAATRPERVERLVLVNPMLLDEVPGKGVEAMQRNTARFAFRVSRGVLGAAPLLRQLLGDSVSDPDHMPDPLVARYLAPFAGQEGLEHLLGLARAIDAEDMEEVELGAIPHPTLVVWGDQDKWCGPKTADRIVDSIPGSRLVRLPSAGRLVPEDAPDALANVVLDFIGTRVATV
jgi:pimeloyl-ACP methyl ester carboxylesterase